MNKYKKTIEPINVENYMPKKLHWANNHQNDKDWGHLKVLTSFAEYLSRKKHGLMCGKLRWLTQLAEHQIIYQYNMQYAIAKKHTISSNNQLMKVIKEQYICYSRVRLMNS